jgi:hypothetical protein
MAQQRILLIDANRLTAYSWSAGDLRGEGEFTADEAGQAAFAAYLQKHPRSLYSLLADAADEGFQSENIPFVRGSDRSAIIRRKLGQYYYGTPLSFALSQGRQTTGRRDEKMLFVALTRPQLFEPWLAALRQASAQVAGLYALPVVAAGLLEKVAGRHPNLLVITLGRAGLRQTFFDHGQLRFSRLTPLSGHTVADGAATAAAESAKIYQYLAGQRLVIRGTPLPTLILAHPAELAQFREQCRDSEELHFGYLDLVAEAKQAGMKAVPRDSHSEGLFLHLLAKRQPAQQMLPAPELRFFRLWQLRVALNGAAAVVLLGCLLFAARQGYEFATLRETAASLQARTAADRERYAEVMQALPPMPMTADNLRAVMNRIGQLERRSPPIEATYVEISKALQDSPRIELSRIDWTLSASADASPQANTPVATAGRAGNPSSATDGNFYAIAEIQGVLPVSMVNDNRAMLDTVNAFANSLRAVGQLQVRILRMPFDVESGKTLRSGDVASTNVAAPSFAVRIVKPLGTS